MDPKLLVEQKAGGLRLVEQLLRDGFPVSVAFWVRTSKGGLWNLYIASSEVDKEKWSHDVYRRLIASMDRVPSKYVTLVDVKLLNERDPVATAAIEFAMRYPASSLPSSRARVWGPSRSGNCISIPRSPGRAFPSRSLTTETKIPTTGRPPFSVGNGIDR